MIAPVVDAFKYLTQVGLLLSLSCVCLQGFLFYLHNVVAFEKVMWSCTRPFVLVSVMDCFLF